MLRESMIYSAWEQQDQLLLCWLQSTLSSPILTKMIGCVHSWQLWDKLHTYFRSQTKAKGIQLRIELRNTKKGTRSISEYLYGIKAIIDSLYSIGDAVSPHEQLGVILHGLPREYESITTLIGSRFEPYQIDEVEALLLAHEVRLEQYKEELLLDTASANVASASPKPPVHAQNPQANVVQHQVNSVPASNAQFQQPQQQEDYNYSDQNSQQKYDQSSGYQGRGGRGNKGDKPRGKGNRVQCQVCSKYGHDASICYHRFNPNYQPVQMFTGHQQPASQFHMPQPQFSFPQPPIQQQQW